MSLFGSNTQTAQAPSTGLFGSGQNAAPSAGSVFGSAYKPSTTPTLGGGLFGQGAAQGAQANGNSSGFGSGAAASSGFGSNANANGSQPQSTGGLFGSTAINTQPASGGLFGNANTSNNNGGNNQATGNSLFGASLNQQQQQQQQQQTTGASLFGGAQQSNAQSAPSLFGSTLSASNANKPSLFGSAPSLNMQPPQQQASQQLGGSVFSPPTVSVGAQGHLIPSASLQRLQMSGFSTVPNERKIADQIRTLTNKWNPQDGNTLLKAYLYNAVDKSYAPFFYPDAQSGEDEQGWEEALNQRPTMPKVEGAEATALAFVPVLCRGFKALGDRVETQAKSVLEMRNRLHEMNNSLSAVMDKHQQSITVRIENAKRQHQVLSQRCLHLAVKVQVLRNRGYALDAAEEGLRRTLIDLNQRVHDDGLSGREDEIWARMVALRERTRWLEEEGKRVAAQVDTQQQQRQNGAGSGGNNSDSIPQHVLLKTRKIMKDYHDQLTHLSKELEEVTQEYARYQSTQR